ncbi:MAG: hypothetical protein CM15mP8_1030 [Methanobacteriota archaeon]|nr:MAG: hypothetical protein CM15mP8_1030 [Euryarchaeota archaeon]
MDYGLKHLYQVGIRAFSKQEYERIIADEKITTFFAFDTLESETKWQQWLDTLQAMRDQFI